MFNKLFKINNQEPIQNTNELVQEIHDTFFSEVDRLKEFGTKLNSLHSNKAKEVEKAERLRALGFNNTIEVDEAKVEEERLNKLKKENKEKEQLIRAINYFSTKYPMYKFITTESVINICQKYGLIYGTVDRFIGTVPDNNLQQIENFKISDEDKCYLETISYIFDRLPRRKYVDFRKYQQFIQTKTETGMVLPTSTGISDHFADYCECPLEIAAPLKDFNMNKSEVKNFKITMLEIPDPVVLQPVLFEGDKYYLIVTAWGLEASDEKVLNSNHN